MQEMPSIAWRQVAACAVLLATCSMIGTTYGIIAVPLGAEFQASRMMLMLSMSIMGVVTAFQSPFLGSMMDRVSLRLLAAVGAALVVAGFVAISYATTLVQVYVIYGVFMAPAGVLLGPMVATVLLSRWFAERRGTALGIALSGIGLGGFIYPPIIQSLLDAFDWREAMRVLALILFVVMLPAVLLIRSRPTGDDGKGTSRNPQEPAMVSPVSPGSHSTRDVLGNPAFWQLAVMMAVVLAGMKGMVTNLVPMAIDVGIDASAAALLISAYAGSMFLAKIVFAGLADRIGLRLLIVACLVGYALGMASIVWSTQGYALIASGVALIGFFGGFMIPMQSLLVLRLFGDKVVGKASGLLNFVTLFALLATPPLFGMVFDLTGTYHGVFIAFVLLALATLVVVVPVLRLDADNGATPAPGTVADLAE